MKAAPLLVAWHNDSAPIYAAHFEPHGKGRLATAGGDNNVRIWMVEQKADEHKVTYLSTLVKHTQAVNVVRWAPQGELLASAGDDGNVLLWAQSELATSHAFGNDSGLEDRETWIVKRMCRSNNASEMYDLAWSPDGSYFITGSMDNVARIFDASTGSIIRQIAEHNHYVQGVAWDPLNEYIATQSSDRSVHVYSLRNHDGQFSLAQHNRVSKMELPPRRRRRTSNSPAPPEFGVRARQSHDTPHIPFAAGSPAPSVSTPGTPSSLALPMNPPPPTAHSRRSSAGNASPSIRRSASPAPSAMPLPAVMPSASPNPYVSMTVKPSNIYANETLTSFFRRLTFAPDGSLLFTPSGQYKTTQPSSADPGKTTDEIINTVYIYGRGGLNKPPIAHLPGHKKPSIAVRCCPIFFNLRLPAPTRNITVDTSAASEDIPQLPEPAVPSMPPPSTTIHGGPSPSPSLRESSPAKHADADQRSPTPGPQPAFALPYRIVYAVATQDAVYVYDTQQQTPLCVVSNLHYATFTDITWSNDGQVLLISSSDGFCSALSFAPNELGSTYRGSLSTSRSRLPSNINTTTSAAASPAGTPLHAPTPPIPGMAASAHPAAPSPSPVPLSAGGSSARGRPASPQRSNSASSIATQSSFNPSAVASQQASIGGIVNNPTPSFSAVPGLAAAGSGAIVPQHHAPTAPTPPMTPLPASASSSFAVSSAVVTAGAAVSRPQQPVPPSLAALGKRGSESEGDGYSAAPGGREVQEPVKRRRIAPTLVESDIISSDAAKASENASSAKPSASS